MTTKGFISNYVTKILRLGPQKIIKKKRKIISMSYFKKIKNEKKMDFKKRKKETRHLDH